MRIEDFPRPPNDNGRGVHWSALIYHPSDRPAPHGVRSVEERRVGARVYRPPRAVRGVGDLAPVETWSAQVLEPTAGELSFWIDELQAMHIKWVKLLDDGGGSSAELCRRLLQAGIMPVVRLYKERPNPDGIGGREYETVSRLVDIGVRYFESNNEPDLPAEWENNHIPDNGMDIVTDNFIREADEILRRGGLPAVPALGPGGRESIIALAVARGRRDLFERGAWLAIHNYTLNHPLDYPDDPVNQHGEPLAEAEYTRYGDWAWGHRSLDLINQLRASNMNPGATIFDDPNCFRGYESFGKMMTDNLGFCVPVISTEGGPVVGWGDDLRYNKLVPEQQMAMQLEIVRRMQNNEVPDWYFSMCTWLLAARALGDWNPTWEQMGWYSHAWDQRFGLAGELPVVQALKDLPSLSRLQPPGTAVLRGRLQRDNGQTLGRVRLSLAESGKAAHSVTTEPGLGFQFEGLTAGTYVLRVVDGGGVVADAITLADGETKSIDVVLRGEGRAAAVSGRVVASDGTPQIAVPIDLYVRQDTDFVLASNCETQAQGAFIFDNQGAGIYRLQVARTTTEPFHLDGWSVTAMPVQLAAAPGFRYVITRVAPVAGSPRRVFGRVFDAQGNGINGVPLQMFWSATGPSPQFPEQASGRDPFKPAGNYEFLASQGVFQIRVVHGDWPSDESPPLDTVAVAGQAGDSFAWQVDFQLQPLRHEQSVVRGHITNAPAGATITLTGSALPDGLRRQTVSTGGDFVFQGLPPGSDYLLTLDNIARLGGPFSLDGTNEFTRNFALTAAIQGQVLGATVGLQVELSRVSPLGWQRTQPVAANGAYRFEQLPAGRYRVRAGTRTTGDIILAAGQAQDAPVLDVRAPNQSTIHGRVLTAAGVPIATAGVNLNRGAEQLAQTLTDAQGLFTFDGLGSGSYSVVLPAYDLSVIAGLDGIHDADLVLTVPDAVVETKPLAEYLLLPRATGAGGQHVQNQLRLLRAYLAGHPESSLGFEVLEAMSAVRVVILGDAGAISPAVQQQLEAAGCVVVRLEGDLYDLAAQLA